MPNLKENGLFYTDRGTGEVCVLLHGFLENAQSWAPVIQSFEDKYRFLAIDLPGHGKSGVLHEEATIDDYAHAVRTLLDALGVNQVRLIGHSMGGYVCLAFAKAFPSRIKGLLLLNSTPQPDTPARIKNRNHGIALATKNYTAIVRMSIANLFTKHYRKNHAEEIAEAQQEALKTEIPSYIGAQKAMMKRPDMTQFWKMAGFQKMMILGNEDLLIDAAAIKKEYQQVNVEIRIITGGHMSLFENPCAVLNAIKEFLSYNNMG